MAGSDHASQRLGNTDPKKRHSGGEPLAYTMSDLTGLVIEPQILSMDSDILKLRYNSQTLKIWIDTASDVASWWRRIFYVITMWRNTVFICISGVRRIFQWEDFSDVTSWWRRRIIFTSSRYDVTEILPLKNPVYATDANKDCICTYGYTSLYLFAHSFYHAICRCFVMFIIKFCVFTSWVYQLIADMNSMRKFITIRNASH